MGTTKHYHVYNEYYDNLIKEGQNQINLVQDRINSQNERINNVDGRVDQLNEKLLEEKRKQNNINNDLNNKISNLENINKNIEKDIKNKNKELEKNKKKLNELEELIQIQNNNMNDLQDQQIIMEKQIKKNNLENQKKFDEHDNKIKSLDLNVKNQNNEIEQLQIKFFEHEDKFNDIDNKILENNIELRDYIDIKEKEQNEKVNKLEKKVDEALKMNNDLLYKFNEYVAKNENDKIELRKNQIEMKKKYIEELNKIKSQLEEMEKYKKNNNQEIHKIKETLQKMEENKNKNDNLFDKELNDNDIEYDEITQKMNEINFRNDELNSQMENILNDGNMKQNIEIFCNKNIKQKSENNEFIEMNLSNHKNIMLISKSGLGKSTLTNYMCDLHGDEKAETSDCEPCTKENKFYNGKIKALEFSIIDTRGFEEEEYTCDDLMENTVKFIDNNSLNINKRVDFLFYLIQGGCLPEEEKEELIKLKKNYPNLPIIVVNTYSDNYNENSYNEIKNEVEKLGFKFCFVNSLDFDNGKEKIKAFGKEKLFEIIKNEFKNSEYLSNINEIHSKIKEKIDLNLNVMKKEIATITNEILKNYFALDYEESILKISNEIIKILNKYVFEEEKEFSDELKNAINQFIIDFFKKSYTLFHKNLEKIIKKKAKSLSKKALKIQNDEIINGKNIKIMSENDFIENYKKKLEIKLTINYEKNAIKKCLDSLSDVLFDNLKNSFENILKSEIKKSSIILK